MFLATEKRRIYAACGVSQTPIYLKEYEAEDAKCQTVKMEEYSGKVVLVVNTATECGFTPQYDDLQDIYEKYHDAGLEIHLNILQKQMSMEKMSILFTDI